MRSYRLIVAVVLAAGSMPAPAQGLPSAPSPARPPLRAGLAQAAPVPPPGEEKPRPPAAPAAAPILTLFPHSLTAPWWISGQINIIAQGHPGFPAAYSGAHSFHSYAESATSYIGTLFLGWQPDHDIRYNTDLLLDFENTAGHGISNTQGLAGFTNLDVVRNGGFGPAPYLARAEIHQTIGLTSHTAPQDRDAFSLATEVPARRIEIRVGKFSLPDVFDVNDVASDSHLQFMNWTVDNNGAWDYAADIRGYTAGGSIEYDAPAWAFRYGIFAMPVMANGAALDWAFSRARGQNWELDWNRSLVRGHEGAIRILAYANNGDMGNYRQAVRDYLAGMTPVPQITSVEKLDTLKYGFGWNSMQEITANLRIATRFGWNDDQEESFCYTEAGQTVLAAADYSGARWHRPGDKVGVAFVSNAIKKDHRNYLKDGGQGFLLGDGRLSYGRENIVESYYNRHAWRGLFFALDGQHIDNPGYNRDRGPVWVFSVRSHVDF